VLRTHLLGLAQVGAFRDRANRIVRSWRGWLCRKGILVAIAVLGVGDRPDDDLGRRKPGADQAKRNASAETRRSRGPRARTGRDSNGLKNWRGWTRAVEVETGRYTHRAWWLPRRPGGGDRRGARLDRTGGPSSGGCETFRFGLRPRQSSRSRRCGPGRQSASEVARRFVSALSVFRALERGRFVARGPRRQPRSATNCKSDHDRRWR